MNVFPASEYHFAEIIRLCQEEDVAVGSVDLDKLAYLQSIDASIEYVRKDTTFTGFYITIGQNRNYCSPFYQYAKTRYEKFIHVERLVVDESYRKMGIAQMLLLHIIKQAQDNTIISIAVNSMPVNVPALKLLEKFAFQPIDEQIIDEQLAVFFFKRMVTQEYIRSVSHYGSVRTRRRMSKVTKD